MPVPHCSSSQVSQWHAYDASASVATPNAAVGDYQHGHKDYTLSRIEEVANKDVEMQDAPSGIQTLYLVLDTNVLIDQLATLKRFCLDVESANLSFRVLFIIPSVVLSELDGLKNREELRWFAQTASTFLLEQVRRKKTIKVQARAETAHTQVNDYETMRKNDIAILDCCLYFKGKGAVALISGDKNLRTDCETEDILTLCPPKRSWTSRELARTLFDSGLGVNFGLFHGHESDPTYRRSRSNKRMGVTEAPTVPSEDSMDVDDEDIGMAEVEEEFVPKHALDALHIQVIDHFSLVLKEVADRIRIQNGDDVAPSQSRYAPGYRQKKFVDWNVGDCLEYLGSKKTLQETRPELRVFLLRRNEDRGWRRGQDWSRQDWMNVLGAVGDIGQQFGDGSVLKSLEALRPHVENIFKRPMRPTGI